MVKYREILRLHAQGLSQRSIAASCSNSRNTVKDVLERAKKQALTWPLESDMSDGEIQELLFPEKHETGKIQRKPDCEYIHKELAESGVPYRFYGMNIHLTVGKTKRSPTATGNSVDSIMSMLLKRKRL